MENGNVTINNQLTTYHTLKLLQMNACLALELSDIMERPCPIAMTINEKYKIAKRLSHEDHSASSVYDPAKYLANTFSKNQFDKYLTMILMFYIILETDVVNN